MIKIYSTPPCPWCKKVKEYFKEKGISFTELNVAEDEKARNEMFEKSGQMGVPVVDINGTFIVGFDQEAIENALENMKNDSGGGKMVIWKCGVCGYIHDGQSAPDKCPKCGALKENFEKLEGEAQVLIEKSRKTNEMHVAIMGLYAKIQKWAHTIKQENLDPPCVEIADRVLKDTTETIQSIKAEIQGHVKKGKWG